MIVSAALLAGCSLLYSEDMQHDLVVNNTLQNDLLSIWKNQLST
jgi:predicted nucleic acid-binding protein